MTAVRLAPLVAVAVLAAARPCAAAEPARIPGVVVTAPRSALLLSEAPAAATLVEREAIDLRDVYRLGDALLEVPGLYVRGSALGESFPSSGVGAISLRGIPRTPRTLVLLDGQPLNNALSGGVNFSAIAMGDVDRVEVVRGPYSALYGGHAMGGVIQVFTAAPTKRELVAEAGGGGGDLPRQGYAVAWRDRLDNGLGWSLGASYRRSDGYEGSDLAVKLPIAGTGATPATGAQPTSTPDGRAGYLVGDKGARPWEQFNASLTLHHDPAPGAKLAAGVAWSKYRTGASSPRTLLRDADGHPLLRGDLALVDAQARIALAESDFLTQTPSIEEEWRIFARGEAALADAVTLRASVGWLDSAFRFPFPTPAATYDSGPGEFFDQPSRRVDADAHLLIDVSEALLVTAGASLNRNSLDRATWSVAYWRDFDTRVRETGTSDGTTWNLAAYAEAQWRAMRWLTLHGGARYDRFSTHGRVTQASAIAFERDYPERSEARVSPKLAAVAALSPDATLRVSYGEGFRAPTLIDLYSRTVAPGAAAGVPVVTEPAPGLAAERVRSLEVGLDARLPTRTRAAVALFAQRLEDLIYRQRLSPVLNVLANAGEAKVEGVEIELAQPLLGERLRLTATASHLFRYDITRNDAVPASVGKRLTDVPQSQYSLSLEGRSHGWSGSIAWRHVSHVFGSGDDLNRNVVQGVYGSYDRHDVVDLALARELAPGVVARLAVGNAADARYFQFWGQPGRSVWLGLEVRR